MRKKLKIPIAYNICILYNTNCNVVILISIFVVTVSLSLSLCVCVLMSSSLNLSNAKVLPFKVHVTKIHNTKCLTFELFIIQKQPSTEATEKLTIVQHCIGYFKLLCEVFVLFSLFFSLFFFSVTNT